MIRRSGLLLVLAAQTACAPGLAGARQTEAVAGTRDHSIIEAVDMVDLQVANLFEAVEKLHPEWIRGRQTNAAARDRMSGQVLAGNSELFVDGQRQGSIDLMRSMRISEVSFIKFYSASEAQVKFGSRNNTTAIAVTTAK